MPRLLSLVAAALLAAGAGLVAAAPPAYAAGPCTGSSGVTVVVDFNSLGGGVPQVCVAGGGGDTASSLFTAAGFSLRHARRQPGFVCRVNEVPQSDPCINTAPADAFWGLWWSPGDGSWRFSTLGVGSLSVPNGGFVAFSWDDVGGSAAPSASAKRAVPPAAEPSQPPAGDRGGGDGRRDGAPGGGAPAAPGSGSEAPPAGVPSSSPGSSATPDTSTPPRRDAEQRRERRERRERRTGPEGAGPGADQTPSASADVEDGPAAAVGDEQVAEPGSEDGLPGWLAPLLIGLLFAGAGVVLYLRRRPTAP